MTHSVVVVRKQAKQVHIPATPTPTGASLSARRSDDKRTTLHLKSA